MNKKIYIAIGILSLSLLGVTSFQVHWLYKSHKSSEHRFNKDVHRSISMAINDELDHRISNVIELMDGESVFFNQYKHHRRKNGVRQKQRGKKMYQMHQTFINTGDSTSVMVVVNDSVFENSVWVNKDSNINTEINIRQKKMDRVLLTVMDKLDNTGNADIMPKSSNSSFDIEFFNKSLQEHLQYLGIDIDYKMAIVGNGNRLVKDIKGLISESEFEESMYIPLGSSHFGRSSVAIFFPDKKLYLISSNALMSLASLFLIIFSIGSIVYIIKMFFQQKRISEMRRDFMNNMTHELKTPISTVSLALEAMQNFDVLDNAERTNQYISIADKENKRLGMLVEKVLKMTAYDSNKIQMKLERINGDTTVAEVVENLTIQIESKGGNIVSELSSDNVLIEVDKIHFTNLIYNLIDNAIKYSDEILSVEVKTFSDGKNFNLSISDKGIGISKSYQDKIFDRFFRVPSGNIHNVKGYGLGLSYVYDTVVKFNGEIAVKSELGKGSEFLIKIPVNNG